MTAPTSAVGTEEPAGLPLHRIPGYLIRRAQQVHNALWVTHIGDQVTSPQYAVLATLAAQPDLSQGRLGELASIDKSSVGEVVVRMVDRGWVTRTRDPVDARRHRLRLATDATAALRHLTPAAARVQEELMASLPAQSRAQFTERLLRVGRFEIGQPGFPPAAPPPVLDLTVPGHLIRCAQQVHTAIWLRTVGAELTGPQYAILHVLATRPNLSQRDLGDLAALDKSTLADLVDRLHRRGLLHRDRDPADGRGKLVRLTNTAAASMPQFAANMAAVQRELVETLRPESRDAFIAQLATVAFAGEAPTEH